MNTIYRKTIRLIGVSETAHTAHDAEDVVVGGIDTNLCGLGSLNCSVGEHELECGIVNAGEVARARGLVLLRSQGK